MTIDDIIKKITLGLQTLPFIKGIVLGGSRATGTATELSDIDIIIYYDSGLIDFEKLNEVIQQLDDTQRQNIICAEGERGNRVNYGGWLTISMFNVDIILRDIDRVREVVINSDFGTLAPEYQTGRPHAFADTIYRGELASGILLYARDDEFLQLKFNAEKYPPEAQKAIIDLFSFEAEYSCTLAEKNLGKSDVYYFAGHIFRSVSAINQVLFALNKKWCLNEKNETARIDSFLYKPERYSLKVNNIFNNIGTSQAYSARMLRALICETAELSRI